MHKQCIASLLVVSLDLGCVSGVSRGQFLAKRQIAKERVQFYLSLQPKRPGLGKIQGTFCSALDGSACGGHFSHLTKANLMSSVLQALLRCNRKREFSPKFWKVSISWLFKCIGTDFVSHPALHSPCPEYPVYIIFPVCSTHFLFSSLVFIWSSHSTSLHLQVECWLRWLYFVP